MSVSSEYLSFSNFSEFIFSSFNSFFQDAAEYKDRVVEYLNRLIKIADDYGYDLSDLSIEKQVKKISLFSMAGNITKATGAFMGNFFLVIVSLFFLLRMSRNFSQ